MALGLEIPKNHIVNTSWLEKNYNDSKLVIIDTREKVDYEKGHIKNVMTVQHISVHRKYEDALKSFNHENIKILETTYHNNKIKIGHLKGNNFFIRLKRVGLVEKQKIEEAFSKIAVFGMPNYFGFQRFGIDGENYKKGMTKEEEDTVTQFGDHHVHNDHH